MSRRNSTDYDNLPSPIKTFEPYEDNIIKKKTKTTIKSQITTNIISHPIETHSHSKKNKKHKKRKNRCHHCRKKIGLITFNCRCDHVFCSKHKFPDEHNCTFDYINLGKNEIIKNNPKVVAEKIIRI